MKIQIAKEEWWPVYMIENDPVYFFDYSATIDLPDEFVERYNKIIEEFSKLQDELEVIFKEKANDQTR